jgi:NADH-quinone oxidoreductase subunit C
VDSRGIRGEIKTSVDFKSYIEANAGKNVSFLEDGEMPILRLEKGKILKTSSVLKECGYNHLSDVTVVDYLDDGEFEVIYHLWSHERLERMMLKTRISRNHASIATVTSIWRSAHMHERENHEMFGIIFEGHGDLFPLLLEDWDNIPPMRKDFDSRKFVTEELYGDENL